MKKIGRRNSHQDRIVSVNLECKKEIFPQEKGIFIQAGVAA